MPPEKTHPLFPSNPIQKVKVLSSPLFLKNCLEAQPTSPPPPAGRESAHYGRA